MDQVYRLMCEGVSEGVFPGGVVLASKEGRVLLFEDFGTANLDTGLPVRKDTVFDLASLTKPLATTLAIMKLIERGKLDLAMPIGSLLHEFKDTDKSHITIRNLLCHNSGLPDYRPYFEKLREFPRIIRKKKLHDFLIHEAPAYPTGGKVVYSDLGFMLLHWIVEQVGQTRIDRLLQSDVYSALDPNHLFYRDLWAQAEPTVGTGLQFAATEKCPWREKILVGEVHDDNAFVVGGIEGHAGLFGTAQAVHALLLQIINVFQSAGGSMWIDRSIIKDFVKAQPDSYRALGFDRPSKPVSSSGRFFSETTIGHLGFTGTSFWVDLERAIIIILLTNRVHPTRENDKIKQFRPVLHDAVMHEVL